MSFQSDVISALKTIIEPITYPEVSGTSMASRSIVRAYMRSDNLLPKTQVFIYSKDPSSIFLENRLNKRVYLFYVDVIVSFVNREEQAQKDINYLVEQIFNKLETNFNNSAWATGYIGNDSIVSKMSILQDKFFLSSISFPIFQRVVTS